jgi:hypothetical protein
MSQPFSTFHENPLHRGVVSVVMDSANSILKRFQSLSFIIHHFELVGERHDKKLLLHYCYYFNLPSASLAQIVETFCKFL